MGEALVQKVHDKLAQVNDSQDSVRLISLWLIKHKDYATQVGEAWRDEVISATPKRRLLLLYIANDVIQTGRKRAPSLKHALQPHIRDALALASNDGKTRSSIEKVLKVWGDRSVFPKAVMTEFEQALSGKPITNSSSSGSSSRRKQPSRTTSTHVRTVSDFKVSALVEALQNFKQFSSEVALKHAALAGIRTDVKQSDISANVKDQATGGRLMEDLHDAGNKLNDYCDSVNVELQDRRYLLQLLNGCLGFQQSRIAQAKAIQEEFSGLSKRVKGVRERLAVKLPALASALEDPESPVAPMVEALSPDNTDGAAAYDPSVDTNEIADMDLDDSDEEPPGPSPQNSPMPIAGAGLLKPQMGIGAGSDGGSLYMPPGVAASLSDSPQASQVSTAQAPLHPPSSSSLSSMPTIGHPGQSTFSLAPQSGTQSSTRRMPVTVTTAASAMMSAPTSLSLGTSSSGSLEAVSPGTPSCNSPPSPGTPEDDEEPPGPDSPPPAAASDAGTATPGQQVSSNMLNILTRLLGQKKAEEGVSNEQADSSALTTESAPGSGGTDSDKPATATTPNGKPLSEILDTLLPTLMGSLQKVQSANPGPSGAPLDSPTSVADAAAPDRSATGIASTARVQPLALPGDPLSNMAAVAAGSSTASLASPQKWPPSSPAPSVPMVAFEAVTSPTSAGPLAPLQPITPSQPPPGVFPPGPMPQPPVPPGMPMPPGMVLPPGQPPTSSGPPVAPFVPPPFLQGPPQPPPGFCPPPGMAGGAFPPPGVGPGRIPFPRGVHPPGVGVGLPPVSAAGEMPLGGPQGMDAPSNRSDATREGDETPPLEDLESSPGSGAGDGGSFNPFTSASTMFLSNAGAPLMSMPPPATTMAFPDQPTFQVGPGRGPGPGGPGPRAGPMHPFGPVSGAGGGGGDPGVIGTSNGEQLPPGWKTPLKRGHFPPDGFAPDGFAPDGFAPPPSRRRQDTPQPRAPASRTSGYFDIGFDG